MFHPQDLNIDTESEKDIDGEIHMCHQNPASSTCLQNPVSHAMGKPRDICTNCRTKAGHLPQLLLIARLGTAHAIRQDS